MFGLGAVELALVAGALLAALVALLVLTTLLARQGRSARRLADRVAALESELAAADAPERSSAGSTPSVVSTPGEDAASYVITRVGEPAADSADEPDGPARGRQEVHTGRIDGRLFADIVARESLIKAAGLAHGLRRALAPQTRNRIRFEMKREVKRARKQRRADLKAALRDLRAREDVA